ncbi:hypothetical protein OC846_004969 [Tilletia horrida]|uniref:Uncharacterized protein n=1 Tax=Tilletia horrida TaxID=155126 RepID=A0AAN6GPG5_9BASI|nr:hypothetical protein OC846_004969 [Tilletia horrida]KAK0548675.1 hypothetical protein OC845_003464 [Tilletia horrida]KAK0565591.1 hypothetical protein OC861_003685 [Tilletia horrida]
MGPPQGTPTVVPVISTWTSGTSTWTATDHWSTVYGGAGGSGAGPTGAATPAPSGTAWAAGNGSGSSSSSSSASTTKPSRPDHKPNKSRLAAMAIMSARSKAVAAQASAGSTGVSSSPYLGPNDGSWVLPSSGQIFAGGQDVTLSWRSNKKPPDSTTLSLCLLKNEGDLRAVQSGIQNNGACGSSTTPTIVAGAQAGIWTISFTAPNVTSADSFYVLLSRSVNGPAASTGATSTKSAAKASQSAKNKKSKDRKDRDGRKDRSGSGSDDGESDGSSGSEDDEGSYEGNDDDEGYSSGGNSDSYGKEKGWSSLLRERSIADRRSHDGTSDGSGSGSGSNSENPGNPSGSMLSPAFVLAPYGSDTNPAAVQSLASTGSSFGSDGSDSLAVAARPGVSVTAVLIPCLLAAMALVGALALLMYRRGRTRAKEEAERVRAAETNAREKAKAEMREFLRRSPTNATSLGASSLYNSGKSEVHYLGGSLPPSRRSYTPTPSYRSHGHQQQYGFSKHPDFERPSFGHSHAAEYQTRSVPYAHYQQHDSVPIRMGHEHLQSRDSVHSSSGKSFASASSGPSGVNSRPASVRVVVASGPTPPPPVHAPTPPLPPPTPPKDHPSVYQRYQHHHQQQHEGIPLVRSGSAGGAATPPVVTMVNGMAPHSHVPNVAGFQPAANGQVPTVTFTSPTASSPSSSLWARVTNPFNFYAQAAQASLPITQPRSGSPPQPAPLVSTGMLAYAQPQYNPAFPPASAATLIRPIPTASIPMIQPPIPALVSPPLPQQQRLTMTVPTALASETVPMPHGPESIPSVLRNGSLKNLGQPF